MALIIEDGTIIDNANSFANVEECRAFADSRGLTLPADDKAVEVLLVKACDFLFSLETDFQGTRVDAEQQLPFPRNSILLYGADISGIVPKVIKQAQCRLAFDASQGELLATGSGRVISKEQVGPLQNEYADDGEDNPQLQLTAALTILQPLFADGSAAGGDHCINISTV